MTRIVRGVLVALLLAAGASCMAWAVPGRGVVLPVCEGRYVYPDSAGHCRPGKDSIRVRDTTRVE